MEKLYDRITESVFSDNKNAGKIATEEFQNIILDAFPGCSGYDSNTGMILIDKPRILDYGPDNFAKLAEHGIKINGFKTKNANITIHDIKVNSFFTKVENEGPFSFENVTGLDKVEITGKGYTDIGTASKCRVTVIGKKGLTFRAPQGKSSIDVTKANVPMDDGYMTFKGYATVKCNTPSITAKTVKFEDMKPKFLQATILQFMSDDDVKQFEKIDRMPHIDRESDLWLRDKFKDYDPAVMFGLDKINGLNDVLIANYHGPYDGLTFRAVRELPPRGRYETKIPCAGGWSLIFNN